MVLVFVLKQLEMWTDYDSFDGSMHEFGFRKIEYVDSGSFGTVFAGERRHYGQIFAEIAAVKYIDASKQPINTSDYQFLAKLDHPNVAKYFGTACEEKLGVKTIIILGQYYYGREKHCTQL